MARKIIKRVPPDLQRRMFAMKSDNLQQLIVHCYLRKRENRLQITAPKNVYVTHTFLTQVISLSRQILKNRRGSN